MCLGFGDSNRQTQTTKHVNTRLPHLVCLPAYLVNIFSTHAEIKASAHEQELREQARTTNDGECGQATRNKKGKIKHRISIANERL